MDDDNMKMTIQKRCSDMHTDKMTMDEKRESTLIPLMPKT